MSGDPLPPFPTANVFQWMAAIFASVAIIFVSPVSGLALAMLAPNILELLTRFLRDSPRGPVTVMLLVQTALLALPIITFMSWRLGRSLTTVLFSCATIGVGLFAYTWIVRMVAAFPD